MDGNTRRQAIIKELTQASAPLSGNTLAAKMSVSRQVIVQDIALLRTEYPILATAQGYVLYVPAHRKCVRAFLVKHDHQSIHEELTTIVALGGLVLDVIVEHDVYGQLRADLNLITRSDVDHFCERLNRSTPGPLFPISQGVHLHTVEAESEQILDNIQKKLNEKGFLIN